MNKTAVLGLIIASSPIVAEAEQILLAPLFDYPVPPESMTDLPERSDWLMENFWKPMDFSSKQPVEQARLNHAFEVYSIAMQWADREKIFRSLDELQKKLKKNPALATQFTLAAEENLYGPRAAFWIDEVYLRILNQTLKEKKIPERLRQRWQHQFDAITASQSGKNAPEFEFISPSGETKHYFAMSTPTLLIFANSREPQMRLDILRTETNTELQRILTQGQANILLIDPVSGDADLSSLPERWTAGTIDKSALTSLPYDIRVLPTVYLIGTDGKIETRHSSIPSAVSDLTARITDK